MIETKERAMEEVQAAQSRESELQRFVEESEGRANQAEQMMNAAVREVDELRQAVSELETTLYERNRQDIETKSSIKTWQEQVAMLQSQLGETNMRQSRLNKELRDANTREFVKGRALGCKRGRVNTSRRQEEQRLVFQELEMQLESFRTKEAELQNRIETAESEKRLVEGRLSTKADAEVKLRSEIASLSGDVETFKRCGCVRH